MTAGEDGAARSRVGLADGEDGDDRSRRVIAELEEHRAELAEREQARGAGTDMLHLFASLGDRNEDEEDERAVLAKEVEGAGGLVPNELCAPPVNNLVNCTDVHVGTKLTITLNLPDNTRNEPADISNVLTDSLNQVARTVGAQRQPPCEGPKEDPIGDNEKNSVLELSMPKKILNQVVPRTVTGRTLWSLFIMLLLAAAAAVIAVTLSSSATPTPTPPTPDPPSVDDDGIVTRAAWGAIPRRCTPNPLSTPVPYVIISHTVTPNCFNKNSCSERARNIQADHQSRDDIQCDIGFNFLVGGDGRAYEGRGWHTRGAHTYGFNSRSIGVAFVGDFGQVHPTEAALRRAQTLLEAAVRRGALLPEYKVLGQRQVFTTVSPGDALYSDIKKWPGWASEP